MRMKAKINAIVDLLALIAFIPMFLSGTVLYTVYPTVQNIFGTGGAGRRQYGTIDFLGLSHTDWISMHDISSFIFILLMVIHLFLHWRYMVNIGKHLGKKKCK